MKIKLFGLASFLGAALVMAVPAVPSNAAVLSSSGPSASDPYNLNALNIFSDYQVTDQFTLGAVSTVTGITFGVWTGGGTLQSVNWAITTAAFGGTVVGSGTATSFTSAGVPPPSGLNGQFNVTTETFSLPISLNLAAGSYWLQFSSGVSSTGSNVYWDEASETGGNGIQTFQGQQINAGFDTTFQILGESGINPVPLPAALPLFAGGLGALGLLGWRRKRKAAALAA